MSNIGKLFILIGIMWLFQLWFAYKQAKCQLNKCYKCNKTFLNYTDVIIPKHVLLLSCPNQLACPSKQNIIISLTSYWSTYQRSHNQQNLVYLTLELKPWTFPRVSKGNFLAEPRTIQVGRYNWSQYLPSNQGGSPGLVVMGRDSSSEGCGIESQHLILDGHFFTYICHKNCNDCLLKRRK